MDERCLSEQMTLIKKVIELPKEGSFLVVVVRGGGGGGGTTFTTKRIMKAIFLLLGKKKTSTQAADLDRLLVLYINNGGIRGGAKN